MLSRLRPSLITVVAASALAGWVSPSFAAPFTLTHSVDNPTPASSDFFGYSVGVSGSTAIIGASLDDTVASNAGAAYLVDTTTGTVTHTLTSPTPNASGQFGFNVGIDGNRAIVGAIRAHGTASEQGEAYIYDATTGSLVTTLVNPNPSFSDEFGWSVDISGNLAVVGAWREDSLGGDAGLAYVFDAITGSLLHTLASPFATSLDRFGSAVAIDGNLIAVAARNEDVGAVDAGAVFVFDAISGNLVSSLFDPNPGPGDLFGFGLDIDDGKVLVGSPLDDIAAGNAGQAFLFDAVTGNLLNTFDNPDVTLNDQFGRAVSLSDGFAAIGAFADDPGGTSSAGSAYIFDSLTGNFLQAIANPFPNAFDNFSGIENDGIAIDGGTLLVGAYLNDPPTNSGQAYIYNAEIPQGDGVPGPGALALLGFGMLGIGIMRRKLSP